MTRKNIFGIEIERCSQARLAITSCASKEALRLKGQKEGRLLKDLAGRLPDHALCAAQDVGSYQRYWHLHDQNAFHAFGAAPLPWWGFSLLETQSAKLLEHVLCDGLRRFQTERISSFLEAVRSPLASRFHQKAVDHNSIIIQVERLIDEGRRIDFVAEWMDDSGKKYAVIVEVKIGAGLHGDQIEHYENYARSQGYTAYDLVLLAPDVQRRALVELRRWRRISWFELLRNWEACEAMSNAEFPFSDSFAQAKRTLWRDCT